MENKESRLDELIKNSYDKIEVPSYIFEEAYNNLGDNKEKHTIFKYVVSLAAIVTIIAIVYLFNIKDTNVDNNDNNITIIGNENVVEAELPVATDVINTFGETYQPIQSYISPVGLTMVEQDATFVGVVKINKIIGYTNFIKKLNKYNPTPFIISNVSVEKVYKGDLNGNVEIMSYGGVITVSDYEKSLIEGKMLEEKYSNMTKEEKESTYVTIYDTFTLNTIEPNIGKYYLVFMKYSDNLESYQVLDTLIYEYDIYEDKVKNPITNEWEKYEFGK